MTMIAIVKIIQKTAIAGTIFAENLPTIFVPLKITSPAISAMTNPTMWESTLNASSIAAEELLA
jgi:hypothetical protein